MRRDYRQYPAYVMWNDHMVERAKQLSLKRMSFDDTGNEHCGIYFLAHGLMPDTLKIGYSIDIARRMDTIDKKLHRKFERVQQGSMVRAICYIPFGGRHLEHHMYELETKIHWSLRPHKFFSEWFHESAVIERLCQWFPIYYDLIDDYAQSLAVQS